MVYHDWADNDVDWKGINEAADYIGWNLRRFGRVHTDWKEKFGCVRVYTMFGWQSLHDVIYPSYHFVQNKWVTKVPLSWLNGIIVPLQIKLYRHLYKRAIQKWPHLREEILYDADWPEHLGGI